MLCVCVCMLGQGDASRDACIAVHMTYPVVLVLTSTCCEDRSGRDLHGW